MPYIFISYRRNDSRLFCGRVNDRLIQSFGKSNVFFDIDNSIPQGNDWEKYIAEYLNKTQVLLVIIGHTWLQQLEERSLANEVDYVNFEIEKCLERHIEIIPVIIDNAKLPTPQELANLSANTQFLVKQLLKRQVAHVRSDPDFHDDMDELIRAIRSKFPKTFRQIFLIGILVIILIVGLLFITQQNKENPKDDNEITLATHTPANDFTEVALLKTYSAKPSGTPTPNKTASLDAASTLVAITFTVQAQETLDSNPNNPTFTPLYTDILTSTEITPLIPTSSQTMDFTATTFAESTKQVEFLEETSFVETQNAQSTENAPTNTPKPTNTKTSTITYTPSATHSPTDTVTYTPTLADTPTTAPDFDQTVTIQIGTQDAVSTSIFKTAVVEESLRETQQYLTLTATTPCTASIQLASVNVRAEASSSGSLLGTASKNDSFTVLSISDQQSDGFSWIGISFNDESGYMRSDLVSLSGDCTQYISDERLSAPVSAAISQGYSAKHQALDFPIPIGTQLTAPLNATVIRSYACPNCQGTPSNIFTTDPVRINQIFSDANWGFGYGEHIILAFRFEDIPSSAQQEILNLGGSSEDKVFVLYSSLSIRSVDIAETIEEGTVIGFTGHTGFSSAPHLHLQVAFGKAWSSATIIHPSILFQVLNITE
jgi:hypothetical protein